MKKRRKPPTGKLSRIQKAYLAALKREGRRTAGKSKVKPHAR